MCRDGKLEESLLKRRAAIALAARRIHQIALGQFLQFVQKRTHHLVEHVEVNDAQIRTRSIVLLP